MKNKTAKITIRARGYGKSITLNDSQTDLVLRALENEINLAKKHPWMDEHKNLEIIWNAIQEGPK